MSVAFSDPRATPASTFTRMVCHATDPNPVTRREKPGARCGRLLGYVPGELRFVDVAARAPDEPDGRIWARCARSDCHAWNVFAIVGPE